MQILTLLLGSWMGWTLMAVLPLLSHQTPIVKEFDRNTVISLGPNYCILPPELGHDGNVTFLEDCPSLDR